MRNDLRLRSPFRSLAQGLLLVLTTLAAMLTFATAANAADCTTQCIGPVTVTPGSIGATFTFETSVPAGYRLVLTGTSSTGGQSILTNGTKVVKHQGTAGGLSPVSPYTWTLTVTDAAGHQQSKTGSLTTKSACYDYCLSAYTPQPGGGFLRMDVTTRFPTTASMIVLDAVGNLKTSAADGTFRTTHALVTSTALRPSTTYKYILVVKDAQGVQQSRSGTFVTKARRISLTVAKVRIKDDSDTFGSGEFASFVRVDSSNGLDLIDPWKTISSGGYTSPNRTLAYPNVQRSMKLQVSVIDDDCADIFKLCSYGLQRWNTGSDADADWTTATTTVTAPDLGTVVLNQPITMTGSGPVDFVLEGAYTIDYV